jgi:glycosyltransferase involved in cell wall biosynthesis
MQTGIADYTYELLAGLAPERHCTVVCEDGISHLHAPRGVELVSLAEYYRRLSYFEESTHLYHLGNNPDHVYMLPVLVARPGIVVLHDPALHHLLDCATAALGDFEKYAAAVAAEYGGPGRVLAKQFLESRLRDMTMVREMPMLAGIIGPARGVIVHSQFAAVKVLARMPSAAVTVVPHHYVPPVPPPQARAELRAVWGFGAADILFLSLGFVTHTKCLDRVLTALSLVAEDMPPFRYIVAGERRPYEPDIREMADRMGLSDRVLTIGFVNDAQFYELIAAADIVVNLRHPVGGETSGTLIRALGGGACTVVVDRGPFAEIPDEATVKVPWGTGFDLRLAAELRHLAKNPERRARIGAAAARFMAQQHRLEASVAGYLQAITAAEAAPPPDWRSNAQWSFPQHAVHRSSLPLYQPGLRAVYLAPSPPPDASKWPWEAAKFETLARQFASRSVDLVWLKAEAEDFFAGEAEHLRALNRILRFGGMLVIMLTRTIEAPPGKLETHAGGKTLLEARGFTVQDYATGPEPDLQDPPEDIWQQEHCWRVVKTCEFMAQPGWADT